MTRFFLNPSEAAEYLRLSPRTLANWRCLGIGPEFERVGRSVRYRLDVLDAWTKRDHGSSLAPLPTGRNMGLADHLPPSLWEHVRSEAIARGLTPAQVIEDHAISATALRLLRYLRYPLRRED